MKYGFLFSIASALLCITAYLHSNFYILCLWPAVSFGVVAAGYLYFGPVVFGKSKTGLLSKFNTIVLLPYLIYAWTAWHLIRLFKREAAYDQLTDKIYIGRRLMNHEVPSFIDHVIDLTCEFSEPRSFREKKYYSYPILDGFIPRSEDLQTWVLEVSRLEGVIYIHCAEGHGRTGLFAAALLIQQGMFNSIEDALEFIKSKRPLVRLGRRQLQVLTETVTATQT
ncbi:MAG: dual specificity protein phosphatase family protein [Planctomycetaceae bacterium]